MERERDDRSRLKQVHASDLTEGRINQDFLDWLQTKGMSWLLVILVALCVYFGIVRWKSHRTNYQTEAWTELTNAKLPSSLEDIADKYGDVGAVSELARLRAADELLTAVQTGKALGATPTPPPAIGQPTPPGEASKDLTDEEKAGYLNRADGLYAKVLEADDGSAARTLLAVTALIGRAAVAESNGDIAQARQFYTQAAQRAEAGYPDLAARARERAESSELKAKPVTFPTQTELNALMAKRKPNRGMKQATMEPWARELIIDEQEED